MDEKFQSKLLLIYKRPRHEILLTNGILSKLSENVNKIIKGVEQDEIFQKIDKKRTVKWNALLTNEHDLGVENYISEKGKSVSFRKWQNIHQKSDVG